ncbi:unnamed protein product [Calicophoron daubneyi]|uniref:HECT-type E3 ubiquitin transferase n=1 Tax=Calicophoron daubneyi TaxID=300641 RepID=A0AAV2TS14_CALDB
MFSFEGNFRSKQPQIFDRTEKVTTSTIVQRTREERRRRELLRRQHEAATKIQAFGRGVLCRSVTDRVVCTEFDELAAHLNAPVSPLTESARQQDVEAGIFRLLRLFNWHCRRRTDKERLFVICRLSLSVMGSELVTSVLANNSKDNMYTLGRTLLIFLRYLSELPPLSASSDYALPMRVLEENLSKSEANLVSGPSRSNLNWLYEYITRNGYFRYLARFIDKQVPPTAGYLTSESDTDSTSFFDPVEFARPVRTQAFLDLVLIPLKWASISYSSGNDEATQKDAESLLQNMLIAALNDILVSDDATGFIASERIVRGVGCRLFDTRASLQMVPKLCLSSMAPADGSSSTRERFRLIPSINLLHLLVAVVVPRLMSSDQVTPAPEPRPSTEMETDEKDDSLALVSPSVLVMNAVQPCPTESSVETAILIRCVAWMLMQALFVPCLPCVRPLKSPQPLVLNSDETDDESDSEDDANDEELATKGNDNPSGRCSKQHSLYKPTWSTQLPEIFTILRRSLPSLASSALTTLRAPSNSAVSCDSLSDDEYDLVRSLAQLHYALAQVYGLPSPSMIGLNSIYSQNPLHIRCLWYLVQTSQAPVTLTMNQVMTQHSFFRLLSSGEMTEKVTDLQSYLPLVFTFADCLHHRLLCLTDTEICGEQTQSSLDTFEALRMGCGFKSEELLQVGAQLRDLMLGLIDLSHPDQLPKYSQLSLYDRDSGMDCETSDLQAVFERVERRAEAAASGTVLGGSASVCSRSGWPPNDLRLLLHCWTNLFRRVQRLVFQIYDWDRRCHRQSLIQSDIGAMCFPGGPDATPSTSEEMITDQSNSLGQQKAKSRYSRLSTPTQAFWIKESIANTIHASLKSWLQHGGDKATLTLAGAPFGYYSRLNPDRGEADVNPFILSNREVKQVLILKEVPFVIPFERRVRLFQMLVESVRAGVQGSFTPFLAALATYADSEQYPDVSILVRRTHMYEDAFEKLSKENEPSLQPRLRVRFMNQVGAEEAGVDGGGLSREFLSELIRSGFDPTRGFFIYTAEKTLYPNPQSAAITEDYLKHYFFLGRMLAKAIYEGMLVELQFAHFFLAKIASHSGGGVGFDYLHSLDPELYRQLRYLKNYRGNVRDLALDFTVTRSTFGKRDIVELKPGGRQIPVTEHNRVEYMHLVAYYKLNKQIYPQVRAFTAGINDVIPIDWLRLFDADELQTLISGADMVIDVDDLQKHTVYTNNSDDYAETLQHFWSVLRSFSEADKRSFLRFVTACSRPPMFGFRDLQPPFSIQITQELDRLPTASTCMNLLRLPNFRDPNLLRDRLLYALHANAGFEYS